MDFTFLANLSRRLVQIMSSCAAVAIAAFVLSKPSLAGSPVLILRDSENSANPFGAYFGEMLRGEGILSFDESDRSEWDAVPNPAAMLAQYKTIITAEMNLSASERQLLRTYVQNGGTLISARPSSQLSDVFGIKVGQDRDEQYLQYFGVNPAYLALRLRKGHPPKY